MAEATTVQTIDAGGAPTCILSSGTDGAAVVLLHGGLAGRELYTPTVELWRPLLAHLQAPRVIAMDLPGTGGSPIDGPGDLHVAAIVARVGAMLEAADVSEAVLVGHGEASLVAMELARSDSRVKAAAILCGTGTAPTGDGTPPIAVQSPPTPLWSAASQRWAMTRLCYDHSHITPALIDALVAASRDQAHTVAAELMLDRTVGSAVASDWLGAKSRFFAFCRDDGYAVPISIIWAARDPLLSVAHGDALFAALSSTSAHLDLALIPRAGHLAHRDQPEAVAHQIDRLVRLTRWR